MNASVEAEVEGRCQSSPQAAGSCTATAVPLAGLADTASRQGANEPTAKDALAN